jgi:hypothetical protein
MNTRSQIRAALYDVDIDFDDASEAWKANKISIGNGQYKYMPAKCSALIKTNSEKQCSRNCITNSDYCAQHNKTK